MSESSLPRELQLIIDDIVGQNGHLLEWEMFGNTSEDMRAVLTWRRIDSLGDKNKARWKITDTPGRKVRKHFGNGEPDDDDYIEEYWEEGDKQLKERSDSDPKKAEFDAKMKKLKKARKISTSSDDGKLKPRERERKLSTSSDDGTKRVYDDQLAQLIKEENTILNEQKRVEEEKARFLEEENQRLLEQKLLEEEKARLLEEENDRLNRQKQLEEEKARLLEEENERLNNAKKLEEEKQRLFDEERRRKLAEESVEIDLNAKVPHTKEEAEKMYRLQRTKFNKSIDLAHLDDNETKKRFPLGVQYSVYGNDYDPNQAASDWESIVNVPNGDVDQDAVDADGNPYLYDSEGNVIGVGAHGKYGGLDGSGMDGSGGYELGPDGKPLYYGQDGKRIIPYSPGKYQGDDDGKGLGSYYYGLYGKYGGMGPLPAYGLYGGFMYNPKEMSSGYEYEYQGKVYQSRRIKKRKMKPRKISLLQKRIGKPVFRVISPCYNTKGWEGCIDCRYNDFCDDPKHKDEYIHMLFEDAKRPLPDKLEECTCNVCTGGAVHNGCFYRELLRLKTEYLIFDKYNYCFCSECIPFKYRRICLRQEFKLFRYDGADHYDRLTTNDGDDGIVRNQVAWDDEWSSTDEEEEEGLGYGFMQAISMDDVKIDLTRDDKISFRDCPDCQCNGFCDNIRHKKIYLMLLKIDDEDFDILRDECWCLVCEFKGAAHSGCAERELRRLKYDLMLFDVRNLCYCHECVPFKYRQLCLRQELKLKRRNRGIDMYHHLYNTK